MPAAPAQAPAAIKAVQDGDAGSGRKVLPASPASWDPHRGFRDRTVLFTRFPWVTSITTAWGVATKGK